MFVVCHSLFNCCSAAAVTFLYPKMSGTGYENSNDCKNDFFLKKRSSLCDTAKGKGPYGWQWPTLTVATPAKRSRYRFPSTSHSHCMYPWWMNTGLLQQVTFMVMGLQFCLRISIIRSFDIPWTGQRYNMGGPYFISRNRFTIARLGAFIDATQEVKYLLQ